MEQGTRATVLDDPDVFEILMSTICPKAPYANGAGLLLCAIALCAGPGGTGLLPNCHVALDQDGIVGSQYLMCSPRSQPALQTFLPTTLG